MDLESLFCFDITTKGKKYLQSSIAQKTYREKCKWAERTNPTPKNPSVWQDGNCLAEQFIQALNVFFFLIFCHLKVFEEV